jgi:methylglyoxal synthase
MKNEKLNIAVIAHDNKKADMVAFIMKRLEFFKHYVTIFATGTTGKHIEFAGLKVNRLLSGPMGGDAQIAAKIVNKEIDCVIFFMDPLSSHPHEVDVQMLLRLCNVHDTPIATNYSTASKLIKYFEVEE